MYCCLHAAIFLAHITLTAIIIPSIHTHVDIIIISVVCGGGGGGILCISVIVSVVICKKVNMQKIITMYNVVVLAFLTHVSHHP